LVRASRRRKLAVRAAPARPAEAAMPIAPLALRVVLFALCAATAGCGQGASEPAARPVDPSAESSSARYHHPGLGWTFPRPPDWQTMSQAEIERVSGRGREMIERTLDGEIEDHSTPLLYLEHGPGTRFTSVRQPLQRQDGPYPEQQKVLFEVVAQSYRDAGIPIEVERGSETIDGVEFQRMHVRMLSKDRSKEVAQQYVFDALLGEQSLLVSVTSAHAGDLEAGLAAFRASRFARKPAAVRAADTPPP
jgi:hypothetical protein